MNCFNTEAAAGSLNLTETVYWDCCGENVDEVFHLFNS